MPSTTATDDALRLAVEAAESAFPGWRVEPAMFIRRLKEVLDAPTPSGPRRLDALHVADLYLAYGCVLGIPAAVTAFASAYLSKIDFYLRRIPSAQPFEADVRCALEDLLLLPRGGAPPRIGQYAGHGPLDRFVASAARRVALSLLRAHGRRADDVDPLALAVPAAADGSQRILNRRFEAIVRDALRLSLATLDRRQRTIVRLHVSKGIPLTQIAQMLRVHQSTASRSFAAAMTKLHAELRRQLSQHGLSGGELDSVVRDVRSRLDLSLSQALRDTASAI